MAQFTVIEVKTTPNLERIKEYAKKYKMTPKEALEKKRIGDDYFPIRDQKIVSIGMFSVIMDKDDKFGVSAAVFAGEEKKVIEEAAKKLATIMKTAGKPFFVTGDGRKYALELITGRAMNYLIEAKRKDQEIIPEVMNMLKLLTNPRNGYLKPFDVKDSMDLQAILGLGTDRTPLPDKMKYENEDLPMLANETKDAVLDMATNYAAYLEAQGEKIKPIIYKLDEKAFKTVKIFKFKEEQEIGETDVDIDII